MENNTDKIDRYFRERLLLFEQEPSHSAWENIAKKLGHRKRKTMALLFFRIAAGMALIVSLGVAYVVITKSGGKTETAAVSVNPGSTAGIRAVSPGADLQKNTVTDLSAENHEQAMVPAEESAPVPEAQQVAGENTLTPPQSPVDETVPIRLKTRSLAYLPVNLPTGLTRYRQPEKKVPLSPSLTMPGDELYTASTYEDETEKPATSHWALGSEIAPLYSYRTISSDYLNSSTMSDLNEGESGLLAYAGGIRVAFSAGRRLSVQSGVYYSRYGQEKNNVDVYNSVYTDVASGSDKQTYLSVSNSTGVISSDNPAESGYDRVITNSPGGVSTQNFYSGFMGLDHENLSPVQGSDVTATQYFDYLEVPLTLKYKIIDRKLDFSLLGGLVTNFLVGNKITLSQNGDTRDFGKTTGINQVNYLGSVGLGFEYPVVHNFAFSIEPRFRYYLNPLDNSSQINVHPFSFGFFAGISYFF